MAKKKGKEEGPQFVRYYAPMVEALRKLGGSARPAEVQDTVASIMGLSEEEQSRLTSGGAPQFYNQVAWARFYLAKAGIIDSSKRGVWTLTEKGRNLTSFTHSDALELFKEVRSNFNSSDQSEEVDGPNETIAPTEESIPTLGINHRVTVLEKLRTLPPSGFEQFSQRVLRESGFQDVSVTGKTSDGGIDGIGVLQINPLVSFKVLFQCKRYSGSVGAPQVRDFRGAMMGRADKGIMLTTGVFTADARKEAMRDGVPPIELVDGEKLVDMLEELELGLSQIRAFRVDDDFFKEFN